MDFRYIAATAQIYQNTLSISILIPFLDLTLVCFNTFQLKAQNPAREGFGKYKKIAMGKIQANHLMIMERGKSDR